MNNTPQERFIRYADNMLENIADELNIKQVHLTPSNGQESVIYSYDTISGRSKGFNSPSNLLYVLARFFTGNVIEDMQNIRNVVNTGLSERNKAGIKVRQPLNKVTLSVDMGV